MSEPYSDEHIEVAQQILEKALDELLAAGIGGVEACHAAANMALSMLPAFCCRKCLEREYGFMSVAIEARIESIPSIPDNEIAQSCQERLH